MVSEEVDLPHGQAEQALKSTENKKNAEISISLRRLSCTLLLAVFMPLVRMRIVGGRLNRR